MSISKEQKIVDRVMRYNYYGAFEGFDSMTLNGRRYMVFNGGLCLLATTGLYSYGYMPSINGADNIEKLFTDNGLDYADIGLKINMSVKDLKAYQNECKSRGKKRNTPYAIKVDKGYILIDVAKLIDILEFVNADCFYVNLNDKFAYGFYNDAIYAESEDKNRLGVLDSNIYSGELKNIDSDLIKEIVA